jgi:hypothetical protein
VAIGTIYYVPDDAIIDVRRQRLTVSHIGGGGALNAECLADLIYGLRGLIRKVFSS